MKVYVVGWVVIGLHAELGRGIAMDKILRKMLTTFWFKHFLSNFKWYRKWHGGRWEYWYVDICKSMIWHDIKKGKQGYPNRPPCCFGTPVIEDYPYNEVR